MRKNISTITPEQHRENMLRRALEMSAHISEPNHNFEIGQDVIVGNLPNAKIVGILEGGKIIEIKSDNGIMFTDWMNAFVPNNLESSMANKEIPDLTFSNRTIDGLLSMKYSFGMNMNPFYQRGYEWSHEDKLNLINSVFNKIDIGKFVVVHYEYDERVYTYEILDGKQRLNALFEFHEGRISYKGYTFREMSKRDRHFFMDRVIQVATINYENDEQILNHFIRLNTTGKVISQEHMDRVKNLLLALDTGKK